MVESVGDGGRAGRFVERCRVYFDDLDAFWMLRNGRYVALFNRGFLACTARMGFGLGHEDVTVVVRETRLAFGEPMRRVGEVDLVFLVTRICRSTATFELSVHGDGVWLDDSPHPGAQRPLQLMRTFSCERNDSRGQCDPARGELRRRHGRRRHGQPGGCRPAKASRNTRSVRSAGTTGYGQLPNQTTVLWS